MAILAGVLILFAPALLQPGGLIYPVRGPFTDLTITHWPAFAYLRDWLGRTGAFPLWRTSILSGTPFAADPVSGVWYPPNWLAIVAPLEWFFKFIVVAHLFVGGWAMLRLAQSLGAGWIGATASGMAYAIAPRAIGHTGAGHVTLVEAWAWIPVMVWAARGGRGRMSVLASGAALGLCALADLRAAAYAGIVLVAHMLLVSAQPVSSRLPRLLAMLLVAALVSAATWLPALSLTAESTRASLSPDEAGVFALPGEYLLHALLANRGDPERLTYVGLTVLVLAGIGLRAIWRERRRVALWLIALTAIGAIGALGANTPLYDVLYRLPGVSLLRVPGRAWFLVAFAAALACGPGIDELMRRTGEPRLGRAWKLTGLLVGWFALLFGAGGALIVFANGQANAQQVGLSWIGLAVFLPLTIGLAIARASGRLAPKRFGAIALAMIAIDLMWVGWGQYRVVPRDQAFADGRAVAETIVSAAGGSSASGDASYRVYSPSYSVPQHVAQAYGLELADGIDPLQLERTVRFMQRATGVGEWGYSVTLPAFEGLRDEELRTWLADFVPDPALLGLLNVKYVAAHFPIAHPDLIEVARVDGTIVYENARARPRAWVVGRVGVATDQAEAMDWLAAHDIGEEAVVEGGRALSLNLAAGEAEIITRVPDRIVLSARGPGLLVLSEVHEHDWRASIDGAAARIYPANGVLRGVYLDEGPHRVEFVYDPVVVKVAVAISGVGLGGWVVGWLFFARRWATA